MYTEAHNIALTKQAQRSLRDKVIGGNASAMIASINTKSLTVRGWNLELHYQSEAAGGQAWTRDDGYGDDGTEYLYRLWMRLTFTRDDDRKPEIYEAASIIRTLATRCSQPSFGKWTLAFVDGSAYEIPDDDDVSNNINRDLIGYADVELPDEDEWGDGFSHLFGLGSHISRVRSALEAGADSGWSNRFHCALVGKPGCGKSDIGESLRRLLGEDAVMKLDATATTAAGAIKQLSELDILPRIIVIEEIEKAPEAAMSFLLGVLDQRSEIRKTTARGTVQRDTKLLAIATVNDYGLFQKLQAGALASRFPNTIFFKRPSRETLALILAREITKVNGNHDWAKPTLDYCEDHDITDPRKVISLCLCGRDAWADGSFATALDETSQPED